MMLFKPIYLLIITSSYISFVSCCDDDHGPDTCGDGEISSADALWSHGEGDLQNSKRAPGIRQKGCFKGPALGQVDWSFPLGGPGTLGAPVIDDDGTIYIVGEYPGEPPGGGLRNSGVLAISPNGSLKWFYSVPIIAEPPVLAVGYTSSITIGKDNCIYAAGLDSNLHAINYNGENIWKKKLMVSKVFLDDNYNIYVPSIDTLFCLNSTGDLLWKYFDTVPIGICTQISFGIRNIYCGIIEKGIMAISYSGKKQWFYPVNFDDWGCKKGLLLDEDENIYFKKDDYNIRSIDRYGNFRWLGSVGMVGGMTQPVLRGDYLYFGAFGALYKLDKATGSHAEVISALPYYVSDWTSPLIDDQGTIYIGTRYGPDSYQPKLVAVTADSGKKLWTLEFPEALHTDFDSYPALSSDGRLYLATFGYQPTTVINKIFSIK